MARSAGTLETTLSQDGPGLPAGALVGSGAGVEQPELAGVAVAFALGQRGVRVVRCGQRPVRQLGLHRRQPGPVPLEHLHVAGVGQRVGVRVGVAAVPPGLLEPPLAPRRLRGGPVGRRPVAAARGQVGQVAQAADGVDRHVELLRAHAGPLHVAQPFGPAVAVGVERRHVAHVAHREVVHLVAEAVVAGPPPDQRHRAGELRGLVGVAGVGVRAEVDLPVRGDLVHHLAGPFVDDLADVAQRPQVVLDGLELSGRDRRRTRCTRRRWRRSTGSRASRRRPTGRLSTVPAGGGNSLPSWLANTCRSRASWTESARFCLDHSTLCASSGSPGQVDPGTRGDARPVGQLCWPGPGRGVAAHARDSAVAAATPSSEPATANQTVRPSRGTSSVYVSRPAGAPAVRTVVAARRRGIGHRADHCGFLRARGGRGRARGRPV